MSYRKPSEPLITGVQVRHIIDKVLKKHRVGTGEWKFIGGLAKKGSSEHDIDIMLSRPVLFSSGRGIAYDLHKATGQRVDVFAPKSQKEIEADVREIKGMLKQQFFESEKEFKDLEALEKDPQDTWIYTGQPGELWSTGEVHKRNIGKLHTDR